MLFLSICQFSSPLVRKQNSYARFMGILFFGGIVFLFMRRLAHVQCYLINYLSESLSNYLDFCGNFRVIKINDLEGVNMRVLLKNYTLDLLSSP